MSAPIPALAALVWAIVGPPLLVYGATRVRRGRPGLHKVLMLAWVAIELALLVGFLFLTEPNPRKPDLLALPIFRIHLAFAIGALVGIVWQLVSRAVPRIRPLHRYTGPYVVLVWCLALLTGIYNYVFLYVMR